MKKIAHRLNIEGVKAPGGGRWDLSAVRYILLNGSLSGLAHLEQDKKDPQAGRQEDLPEAPQGRVGHCGGCAAIVGGELWNAVEEVKKRKVRHRNNRG